MTTLTKKPNKVSQLTGSFYRKFNHLDNVKNTISGSYATSDGIIQGKGGDKDTPSPVTVSDFRFNIPNNAVVKRITVHYRHAKRGVCNGKICTKAKHVCNIPAPVISLWRYEGDGGSSKISEKKGTAPIKDTGKHQSLVFDGLWDASIINNSKFHIQMEYKANTNKYTGYVLLTYIYCSIEYFVPQFTAQLWNGNSDKVYNHEEYHIKGICTDAGSTGRSCSVNINVPLGWTYKGFSGNGKVVKVNNQSLIWTPDIKATGYSPNFSTGNSAGMVDIVFDVDVSFASGSDSYTGHFEANVEGDVGSLVGYDAIVYKPVPVQEETTESTPQDYEYSTEDKSTPEIAECIVEELFEYTFIIDNDTIESVIQEIYEYGLTQNWWSGELSPTTREHIISNTKFDFFDAPQPHFWLSKNHKLSHLEDETWEEQEAYIDLSDFIEDNQATLTLKATDYGEDEINCDAHYYPSLSGRSYYTECLSLVFPFHIKPQESSLTVPNMTLLQPNEEELNRLGTGYNYILQTNLKLNTEEEYVRNWYKNFRMGIFNNKIIANCSTYYLQTSTEDEFQGEIKLSSIYDITDGYLTIKSDKPITLTINETEYNITSTTTEIPLNEEYIIPVIYSKVNDNQCILTIKQYNTDDEEMDSFTYHIDFNQEEDTPLTEIETDSTDYDNITISEIFTNAEYWSQSIAGLNTYNNIETEFTYNKNYPFYILITGDYPEGDPDNNNISFLEPCIIEEETYQERLQNGNYPTPIENTINNEDSSEIQIEAYNISDSIIFYNLPLDNDYGTNTERAIRGIELIGTIEQSDRLTLYAKLKSPKGESRQRSIIINDYDTNLDSNNQFHIGGNGDLWGYTTLDITNLENWEIEFSISNNLEETESNINFKNIQLIIYTEEVTDTNIKWYIQNEDTSYYGVFLNDLTIPEGLETDTAYLTVDGTDTNDGYRQNIKEKTITIEFDIGDGCSLEAATASLREFTKLLVNDRDEYNRPIPKRLEFSHYPEVYWEYIMEESLDVEVEMNSYKCKAKLTIPAGTSYDKESTVTSNAGFVNGLATINPVILVKPTDEVVTVRETVTGQEFHIGYSGGWQNKILEIDCINKNAWLVENEEDTEPINLNKYVDWNSSWFRLKGEYNFTGINCVVRTVEIRERW